MVKVPRTFSNIAGDAGRKLVLVGQSGGTHLGGSLLRAAEKLEIPTSFHDVQQAKSKIKLLNSIWWRARSKRYPLGQQFEAKILEVVKEKRPTHLLTTGLTPISRRTLERIRYHNTICLHFSTDDPWNPKAGSNWHLESLRAYDRVFTPRQSNIQQLRDLGCIDVVYLPFGYDRALFDRGLVSEPSVKSGDVLFVGGADPERAEFIRAFARAGLKVTLAGGYWADYPDLASHSVGLLNSQQLAAATQEHKINLCLVRRANRDGHVMRSFEIAAIGGCMLVEDTPEHRAIFGADGLRVRLFETVEQASALAKAMLSDPAERTRLGRAVNEHIKSGGNTYEDRLSFMLSSVSP